jgi:hypothetical protein
MLFESLLKNLHFGEKLIIIKDLCRQDV